MKSSFVHYCFGILFLIIAGASVWLMPTGMYGPKQHLHRKDTVGERKTSRDSSSILQTSRSSQTKEATAQSTVESANRTRRNRDREIQIVPKQQPVRFKSASMPIALAIAALDSSNFSPAEYTVIQDLTMGFDATVALEVARQFTSPNSGISKQLRSPDLVPKPEKAPATAPSVETLSNSDGPVAAAEDAILNDPAYFDLWERAREDSDHQIYLFLGKDRYVQLSAIAAAERIRQPSNEQESPK